MKPYDFLDEQIKDYLHNQSETTAEQVSEDLFDAGDAWMVIGEERFPIPPRTVEMKLMAADYAKRTGSMSWQKV